MYESKYQTVLKRPWARTYHDGNPKAQQQLCTVAGVEQPHRARWSLKVKGTTGNEVCGWRPAMHTCLHKGMQQNKGGGQHYVALAV
jgi:hypothetical protein